MLAGSRIARQARVAELIDERPIRSQSELLGLLSDEGIDVTQATLSRDLVRLGAVKVREGRTLVYAIPTGGPNTRGDDDLTPRAPSELDHGLDRLGAAVGEEHGRPGGCPADAQHRLGELDLRL